MPSLNRRRNSTNLLREQMRARLEREAASDIPSQSTRPTLHLFSAHVVEPPALETGQPATPVALGPVEPSPAMALASLTPLGVDEVHPAPDGSHEAPTRVHNAPDRADDRYRWRCTIIDMFGRQYRPDTERMKLAKDYAYSQRRMIHEAFDKGLFKADVLNALRLGFAPVAMREAHSGIEDVLGRPDECQVLEV